MRKVSVGLVIAVVAGMLALALLGCGGSPADGAAEAPPTEPPAAEAPADEASVEPTAAEETPA